MTPDRWQTIERLYHATLERSPSERDALSRGRVPGRRDAANGGGVADRAWPGRTSNSGRSTGPGASRGPDQAIRRTACSAGPLSRTNVRTVRAAGIAGRGRNGRGVPRDRHAPQPDCGYQDPAARSSCRSGAPRAHTRSGNRLEPQSSAHLHHPRHRQRGRRRLHRHGVPRRRDAATASRRAARSRWGKRSSTAYRLSMRWTSHIAAASFIGTSSLPM